MNKIYKNKSILMKKLALTKMMSQVLKLTLNKILFIINIQNILKKLRKLKFNLQMKNFHQIIIQYVKPKI